MSEERFDLYFKGDLLDGYYADFVKVDMARLFKTDVERIEPFFSGQPQPVKLKVDKAAAAKYQKALKAIGARLLIVPAGQPLPTRHRHRQGTESNAAQPTSESEKAAAPAWKILPPGSDIGERRDQAAVYVDTSRLSLAIVGAPLVDKPKAPEPEPVDTSSLSLADAGEPLVEATRQPEPRPIDTSSLSVGEVGETLVEEDKTPPPPPPNTSHLSLE